MKQTHIHKLGSQLEGRRFKTQVFGRAGQYEAKVNVDDVALRVQQDVSIVPEKTAAVRKGKGLQRLLWSPHLSLTCSR